jgi:glycosyltransferase involved in cell wall biosynthesis
MRILVFSERLAPPPDEGIKKLTLSLAAALRNLGHDVLTLTCGGEDWPEMRVTDFPADRLLRSPALAGRIGTFGPQAVIYVPTASLTLASGLRARMLKRHARNNANVALIATQGRRHGGLVRLAARWVAPDLCAVQSAQTLAQAWALGWRTLQIPPGVDTDMFHPVLPDEKQRLRLKHELPLDAFVVLHAGHLNRRRGVTSLAAITDLACPVLAASTSTPQDEALAGELRRAGVLLITRYVPYIAELYQAADAYLFPVPPNPFDPSAIDLPLSVLEAMACNLPILATRFGALPDVWSDRPGVIFWDNVAGLRAGVARLREHPVDTRPLAEPYNWQAVAKRIVDELVK